MPSQRAIEFASFALFQDVGGRLSSSSRMMWCVDLSKTETEFLLVCLIAGNPFDSDQSLNRDQFLYVLYSEDLMDLESQNQSCQFSNEPDSELPERHTIELSPFPAIILYSLSISSAAMSFQIFVQFIF